MTYLRFSPEEYRSLCRFCQPPLPRGLDLLAFKQLLLTTLSEAQPSLAERIAELDGHKLGLLFDHFAERASAGVPGGPHELSVKELQVLTQACRSYPATVRFLRPFQASLVELLGEVFPSLSRKLGRMSASQFERLYEQLTRRKRDSA
jgi:hypothetical protein